MQIPDYFDIEVTDVPVRLVDVLFTFNFVDSKSEAKRVIEQGGITVDGKKITDKNYVIADLPSWGVRIMKSRRRMVCLQPRFSDNDPEWHTKGHGSNGRLQFLIDLKVEQISQLQDSGHTPTQEP